jgi:hypothetical protein
MKNLIEKFANRLIKQANIVGRRPAQKISFIAARPARIFKEEVTLLGASGPYTEIITYLSYTGTGYSFTGEGWQPSVDFYGRIPLSSIPKGALTPLLEGVELS